MYNSRKRGEKVFSRLVQRINREQRGITGLETAIILIAFVMVASVLAYVVLSAGLFSSQKAKEAIHAGLAETRSTVDVKGNVLAKVSDNVVTEVYFTVGSVSGGEAIDFTDTSEGNNVVIISYNDDYQYISSVNWTMRKLTAMNDDNLLDENELFQITVDLSGVSANLTAYKTFALEVKPPKGAVLTVERTIPAKVNDIINLY
jgi:flagellin FlaB